MSNSSVVDISVTEKNFLEQLNLVQNIIDGWVTALDPRRYQTNLPDPGNYLRVIVLGDKQAGKTTFLESILGIQLRVVDGDQDETGSISNNQFGGSELALCYSSRANGDESNSFEFNERSHDPRIIPSKQLSFSRQIPNVRTTLSSCTPYKTNRLASHQMTSITAVTPNYYTDYRSNIASPRSSNSSTIHARVAQRYSSAQTKRRQQKCQSSIPTLISLKRRSESCKVTVPVRAVLLQSVIAPSLSANAEPGAAFTVPGVANDFNSNIPLPTNLGETTSVDVLAFLIQLERCWGAHSEISLQGLHSFRIAVEQGEIIKAEFSSEQNDFLNVSVHEQRVAHSLSQAVNLQTNGNSRSTPLRPSISQKASISFFSKNIMLPQRSGFRGLGATKSYATAYSPIEQSSLSTINSVVYITFYLESLRFVAHILTLGQFLEQLALAHESMLPGDFSKKDKIDTCLYDKELMHVEISSPSLPNIQFLEIPGMASSTSRQLVENMSNKFTTVTSQPFSRINSSMDSQEMKLRERAKHLLRSYALEKTALFVNIVDASRAGKFDYTRQKIKTRMPDTLRWTVELEPQGTRTLIILSKLDLLENVGHLITSLISDGLPWAKEYERRATVMFYNRYEQYLNSRQSPNQHTKASKDVVAVEPLEKSQKKKTERLSFHALGLHHPRVVALSFLLNGKNSVTASLCALELNEILPACSELFTRFVDNEKEALARYLKIMSNHFEIFIGFKRLIYSLITTVTMTVGSQCIEPAATLLLKEKRRLDKKLEIKLQHNTIKTPIEQFEDCFKKFREFLAFVFTKDQKQISLWAQQNNISSEEQINNHLLTSNVPFYTVLSTSCHELKKKLLSLDDNTIITERNRQQLKTKNNAHHGNFSPKKDALNDVTQDQDLVLDANYHVKRLRIIINYCLSEFERVTRSCGSYLKTCLQTHVRASFSREFYSEEQLLAVQAIIAGVYQTQLLTLRRDMKLRFEQHFVTLKEAMFLNKMSKEVKVTDHKQAYTYNSSHENLLQTYQKLWTEVFDSMTYFLIDAFSNLTNIFLSKRSDPLIVSEESNDLGFALRKVLFPENSNKAYVAKKDRLLIRMSLIRQALAQMEIYIEHYPLLYHFCVASVTVSQLNIRQTKEEALFDKEFVDKKLVDKETQNEETIQDDAVDEQTSSITGKSSLISAKTVSMICSGSIGAAVLYSLTRKQN